MANENFNIAQATGWVGDYSRLSYDVLDNYVMVLKEQGVPLLDDELNAMQMMQFNAIRQMGRSAFGDGAFGTGFLCSDENSLANDFDIAGGALIIDGWMIRSETAFTYATQPIAQDALTTPSGARTDKVYLEVWLTEIDGTEDAGIIDPTIGFRTSCRLQQNWAVKVAEAGSVPASGVDGGNVYRWRYWLATIARTATAAISHPMITDQRGIVTLGADGTGPPLSNSAASDLGVASTAGTSADAARGNHVHRRPTLAELGAAALTINTFSGVQTFGAAVTEKKVALASGSINLALANWFSKTITENTTFSLSDVPTTGSVGCFIMDLTNGGAATITWWANMTWEGGTAPALTASGRDVLGFFTHNGGITWTGLLLALDAK